MIRTVSNMATVCRRVALTQVIEKQLKNAHGNEAAALTWMKNFISTYEFKEGNNMEPTADLMKLFGMFVIFQYKELEL